MNKLFKQSLVLACVMLLASAPAFAEGGGKKHKKDKHANAQVEQVENGASKKNQGSTMTKAGEAEAGQAKSKDGNKKKEAKKNKKKNKANV